MGFEPTTFSLGSPRHSYHTRSRSRTGQERPQPDKSGQERTSALSNPIDACPLEPATGGQQRPGAGREGATKVQHGSSKRPGFSLDPAAG